MPFRIEISPQAKDDLKGLDKPVLQAVRDRLERLKENADTIRHLPLKGPFSGFYKLRVYGKYRVIYQLQREQQVIIVVRVGNRSDIYDE